MIWVAFVLGVAGVCGLVGCVVLAARVRSKAQELGTEARRLAQTVRTFQGALRSWHLPMRR